MRNFLMVEEKPEDKFNFWRIRHNQAVRHPEGFEFAICYLLEGLEAYSKTHKQRYGSDVGHDGVLADGIADIAKGIRTLLNGELGRLDAGTLDGYLVRVLVDCGELV